MRPAVLCAILFALLAAPASAQGPMSVDKVAGIEAPKSVKAKVGELVWLEAKSTGRVIWKLESRDRKKFQRVDQDKLKSDKILGLIPREPGEYVVACASIEGGELVEVETTILVEGDTPPHPLPPGPGPTPVPPSDPLVAKLKLAYDADPSPPIVKASSKGLIVALYQAAAEQVKNPAITTTDALLDDLHKTAAGMLPAGALVGLRKVIAAEVQACLGAQPQSLAAELRTAAGNCFARIAAAVDAVK